MIRTESSIRVRYAETDAMGFAHHGNYVTWLELARIEMLDAIHLSYKQLEKEGYFLPVLEVCVSYKKPAYFDDVLKVVCYVREKPGLRIKIEYEVFRGETLLATAASSHAFINKEGQPVRPPKTFLNTFQEAMTALD
jgi:acyl-CoA thioester hydrolase